MYDSDDPLERACARQSSREGMCGICVEDYNFDAPEGMELMAYNRRRPDGSERGHGGHGPMCRTVSCVTRIVSDEASDMLGMDTAVINGSDIEDFCQ